MRRPFSVILAAAGGLVLLLLLAAAIAVWRIDPNDYVAPIEARIKQVTGRDATIRGGINLKVSLTPRLVAHDLALANASWGQAPAMLAAKELEIEVALLPLLQQRIEVIRAVLVDPIIALETDGHGHANWEFGETAAGATPARGAGTSLAAFGISNFAVTNGTVTYRDGKSSAATKIAIDALTLSARDSRSPANAEFRGRIDDVAMALNGQLGSLDSLVNRHWPYPIALAGEIDGQKAAIGTKVRVDGDTVYMDELDVALGPNVVKGAVSVVTGGARLRYNITLTAPLLTATHAAMAAGVQGRPAGVPPAAAGGASGSSNYLFSEAPLPLAILRTVDAAGDMKVARLVVSATREFTGVEIRFTLKDGHLDVPLLKAATFGGTVDAHATLDVPASGAPALALTIDAKNLDLGAELAALDVRRDVKGGKTSVKANVQARGVSLHDWAASASGNFTAIAGPATLTNAHLDLSSAFDRVAKAANPFRDKDPTTELKCAVIRLPLAAGIARIDRSVAAETQKLGVSVSGTLDLRNESIDVTFRPQLRDGISIDIPQIAELIRLRGPLRHPQVSIDAMASVTTAARIGAAVSTGGLSEVGVLLFGAIGRGGSGPCAVALGGPAASTTSARTPQAAQGADPVSKAVGKLFGR
jgi:uncharacterized protein involved in outer membrane biogenesis